MIYVGFVAFVLAMLLVDLKVFHTEAHAPSIKQSGAWVAVWVGLAVAFGISLSFGFLDGNPSKAADYFAGYLIEYSLSVDNMFVFLVIFTYFRVPHAYQHQVLFFGILGAIVFRGLFIAAGVALVNRFEFVLLLFGALLIFTAYRLMREVGEYRPEDNPVLKFFVRHFRTTSRFDGQKLLTVEDGKRVATPLLIVLLVIETTDIVFAVDSIPAIFAITQDPFIILTSNVFAILGLRALYFLLAGSMLRFHLLRYGLSLILGFVGLKLLATAIPCPEGFGLTRVLECHEGTIEVTTLASLAFIITVLVVTVVASLVTSPPEPKQMPRVDPQTLEEDETDA